VHLTPASYQQPGFGTGGRSGLAVTLTFTSSATPLSVCEFYGQRGRALGWKDVAIGPLRVTDR
jgi:hypothetical protein